jgi:hypothetical protein
MSRITAAVAICLIALAGAAVPLALRAQQAGIEVLDHVCDKSGAVTVLKLLVAGPGVVVLQWDNKTVCGTPT